MEAEKNTRTATAQTNRIMPINQYLEHTLLSATCTQADIGQLIEEALENNLFGVCIPPAHVKFGSDLIGGRSLRLVTVAGFPNGYSKSAVKSIEADQAFQDGADEVDMVINLSAVKSANWSNITEDFNSFVHVAKSIQRISKMIIESSLLSENEIRIVCQIANDSGIDFIKTSTGFNGSQARIEDVRLLRNLLRPEIKIKASGGIKTLSQARDLISAGALRIGTSSGVKIAKDYEAAH